MGKVGHKTELVHHFVPLCGMCSLDVHRRRILELVVQPAELGHGFRAFYATTQTPGSRLAASCS